jgi:hypothetical protein
MFEAREFMRKKLIGQNVHVIVDYIQPTSEDANGYSYPEKICGTVTIGGVNVAEALVSKGNIIKINLVTYFRMKSIFQYLEYVLRCFLRLMTRAAFLIQLSFKYSEQIVYWLKILFVLHSKL